MERTSWLKKLRRLESRSINDIDKLFMEQGKQQLPDIAILLKVEFDEKVSDREKGKDRGHSHKKIVSSEIFKMSETSVPDKI